jgi:glutathione S-transferase
VYILYGGPYTRAFIVEMVMAEGAIAHEVRVVDIVDQEHRSPDYLAINPAGRVPTLITPEGVALYETPAINLYLTERHGLI